MQISVWFVEAGTCLGLGHLFFLLFLNGRSRSLIANRYFFLLWPLFAVFLPWINLEYFLFFREPVENFSQISGLEHLSEHWQFLTEHIQQAPIEPTRKLQLQLILFWIFISGVILNSIRLLKSLVGIARIISQATWERKRGFILATIHKDSPVSSFWPFVLWPAEQQPNPVVLLHELEHLKQIHTLDVLWMEIIVCLFWWHPSIYRFRQWMVENHEYLADAGVLKKVDRVAYAETLLIHARQIRQKQLLHYFTRLIKKRLLMMQNKKLSSASHRYWLLLPLTGLLLITMAFRPANEPISIMEAFRLPANSPGLMECELINEAFTLEVPLKKEDGDFSVTSSFGMRVHPFFKKKQLHRGIDYKAPDGTPVYAAANATVIETQREEGGYGVLVILQHADGYLTRYAHLKDFKVEKGEQVTSGQMIAAVGNSGKSIGPHLHFELIKDGKPIDPEPYFKNE